MAQIMENFVNDMNDLLYKHAAFKKISKYKLKFKTKTMDNCSFSIVNFYSKCCISKIRQAKKPCQEE